jgi:hypothetical protein
MTVITTPQKKKIRAAFLDTLEITSESYTQLGKNSNGLELHGDGDAGWLNLKKRNAVKYFNNALMLALIDIDSPLKEKYWDTWHCSNLVTVEAGRAKSKFCKNRWCAICNRIRTAELINRHMDTLQSWQNKQFVTLTLVSPSAENLRPTIDRMYKDFTRLKDNLRKQRIKLIGIRKLEITYNRRADTYHPHFHFITQDNWNDKVINEWLRLNPTSDPDAQDGKKADESSCFELFKYFTKLTSNSSKDDFISPKGLDTIFQCIAGIRTFQTFGFKSAKVVKEDQQSDGSIDDYLETIEYNWMKEAHTWVSMYGDCLTDFKPRETNCPTEKILKS